jgi:hypothetical protein
VAIGGESSSEEDREISQNWLVETPHLHAHRVINGDLGLMLAGNHAGYVKGV